jgi:hypothetical protein
MASPTATSEPLPTSYALMCGIILPAEDHIASILYYLIAFAFLFIGVVIRWIEPESRTVALLMPSVFDLLRVVTYGLLFRQAKGDHDFGLFISTQVMFNLGLPCLANPLLTLLHRAAQSRDKEAEEKDETPEKREFVWLRLIISKTLNS